MQVPLAVSHSRTPASLIDRQSASVLHSTHIPAMFELVVSPHTWFGGSLSPPQ